MSPFLANGPQARPVPGSALARLVGLGGLAAGVGGRVLAGAAQQLASGQRPRLADLVFTPTNAAKLTQQLAHMRGAALKVGQLLSMDTGDFLPPEFAAVLSRLRADADHMPPKQLRDVLDRAWGKGWMGRFVRFDVRPVASASIGQVHRALTKDGRDLAIKVQYPGVRQSIDSDVNNLSGLLRLSGVVPNGLDLGPLLAEARAQLHQEADYQREGALMAQFGALLADNPAFKVPGLHADLSGPDVLAMDYIASQPIEALVTAAQADRDRVVTRLIDLFLEEVFRFRLVQTDPNFANYRYIFETGQIVLLDFGASRSLAPDLSEKLRALMLAQDQTTIRDAAINIGYFDAQLAAPVQKGLLDMMALALAPLHAPEAFDFAATDLVHKIRDMGLALGLERDLDHMPPVEVLFLHRKAGGLFLLAQKLGARIPLAPLILEHAR